MATLSINNLAGTARVFKDRFFDGLKHVWQGPEAIYGQKSVITLVANPPKGSQKVVKCSAEIMVPVASTDPATPNMVGRFGKAQVSFVMSIEASQSEKDELKAQLVNLISSAQFKQLLDDCSSA